MISSCSEANLPHWKKYSRANKAIVAVIKGSVQLLLLFSKSYRSSCSMQSTMMQQISLSFSHVRIYIYANDKVKWPEGKCKMCSNSSRRIYLLALKLEANNSWNNPGEQQEDEFPSSFPALFALRRDSIIHFPVQFDNFLLRDCKAMLRPNANPNPYFVYESLICQRQFAREYKKQRREL